MKEKKEKIVKDKNDKTSEEKKEKNNKIFKITMVIIITLILIMTGICSLLIIESNKKFKNNNDCNNTTIENGGYCNGAILGEDNDNKYSYPDEKIIENAEKLTFSPIAITCSYYDPTIKVTDSSFDPDIAYCTFKVDASFHREEYKYISEIWTEYELNDNVIYDESYINTERKESIKLNTKNNKLHFIHGTKGHTHTDYQDFYTIKFKIKNRSSINSKLNIITLPKILLKTYDGKYYKYDSPTTKFLNSFKITKYTDKKFDNQINFYKYNEAIAKYEKINNYKCQGEDMVCWVGSFDSYYYDSNEGRTLIHDDTKDYLFDFNKGIIKRFDSVDGELLKDNTDEPKYLLVTIDSVKYIIDFKGNVIKKLNNYGFETIYKKLLIQNIYSISNNMMIVTKNNKKGIVKITEDKVVVDFLYDDIKLFDNKYFKAKIGDKWYLYSLDNTKVNENGYKEIFPVKDNLMVVQIDDYLYIKDFKGNNIIDDKIKVVYDYQEFHHAGDPYGYDIKIDDVDKNIIHIYLSSDYLKDYSIDYYSYKYDIQNKKLYNLGKSNSND